MYSEMVHLGLGYPSQSAAVRGLDAKGRDPHAIAELLGIHINVVRARLVESKGKTGGRGRAKRMNGHSSRTDAVLALVAEGKTNSAIARELALSTSIVSALKASAARRKTDGSGPIEKAASAKSGRPVEAVAINEDVKRELRPHAKRREMSVLALAQLILETVVEEKLVDAVLDDRGGA